MNHLKVFVIAFIISWCVFGLAKGQVCVPIKGAEDIVAEAQSILAEGQKVDMGKVPNGKGKQPIVPSRAKGTCTGAESFVDPKNCNHYYTCNHGKFLERFCQKGLQYDEKNHKCDYDYIVKCKEK